MEQKLYVTSEQLQKWLTEHGVKLTGLEQEVGYNKPKFSACFNKSSKSPGQKRKFTSVLTEKMNTAMHLVAEQLRGMLIDVKPEEAVVVCKNRLYYPVAVERLQPLRRYFKIKPFIRKILGWSYARIDGVFICSSNLNYGHVSLDDIMSINTAVLQIAAALDSFRLVPDDTPSTQCKSGNKETKLKKTTTGKKTASTKADPVLEQWKAVKQKYPESVVIFRQGNVYVVISDDADKVASISNLQIEHTNGTSLCVFLSSDLDNILPRLVRENLHIVFDDLKE